LWRFVVEARSGRGGRAGLSAFAEERLPEISDPWSRCLVESLLGSIGEDECLKRAEDEDPNVRARRLCEAGFYLGQVRMLRGDTAGARILFERGVEQDVRQCIEHWGSREELARTELGALDELGRQ
jgi:lipoprotein NlpI